MKLPPPTLRKILLKGSVRMIRSLIVAYPQAMGAAFLDALAPAVSPATLRLLVEEASRGHILSPEIIRHAECEFIKLINEEKLFPTRLSC